MINSCRRSLLRSSSSLRRRRSSHVGIGCIFRHPGVFGSAAPSRRRGQDGGGGNVHDGETEAFNGKGRKRGERLKAPDGSEGSRAKPDLGDSSFHPIQENSNDSLKVTERRNVRFQKLAC